MKLIFYIKKLIWYITGLPFHYLAKIILKGYGWKTDNVFNKHSKGVIIAAPHTSNWDAIWGIIWVASYIWPTRVRLGFKKEASIFPLDFFFQYLGGVPIDRNNKKKINILNKFVDDLNKLNHGFVILTPEGTRKLVKSWNKGFYYIAKKSNAPVLCWKIDYEKKIITMKEPMKITGNFANDIKIINEYYKDTKGKYPNNFSIHEEISSVNLKSSIKN